MWADAAQQLLAIVHGGHLHLHDFGPANALVYSLPLAALRCEDVAAVAFSPRSVATAAAAAEEDEDDDGFNASPAHLCAFATPAGVVSCVVLLSAHAADGAHRGPPSRQRV